VGSFIYFFFGNTVWFTVTHILITTKTSKTSMAVAKMSL